MDFSKEALARWPWLTWLVLVPGRLRQQGSRGKGSRKACPYGVVFKELKFKRSGTTSAVTELPAWALALGGPLPRLSKALEFSCLAFKVLKLHQRRGTWGTTSTPTYPRLSGKSGWLSAQWPAPWKEAPVSASPSLDSGGPPPPHTVQGDSSF